MNLLWQILNGGIVSDLTITGARKTKDTVLIPARDPEVAQSLTGLVTGSDLHYKYALIEQLVQIVYKSPLRTHLLGVDTTNTYEYSMCYPTDGISVSNMSTLKGYAQLPKQTISWGYCQVTGTITATGVLTIPALQVSQQLTFTDGLSCVVLLPNGITLQFSGTCPTSTTGFMLTAYVKPKIDILTTLGSLPEPAVWYTEDLRNIWEHGEPVERLAAYILNVAGAWI